MERRTASVALVGTVLLVATVAPLASVGSAATFGVGFDYNDLSGEEVAKLWAGDVDGQTVSEFAVYERLLENTSGVNATIVQNSSRSDYDTWQDEVNTTGHGDEKTALATTLALAVNGDFRHPSPPDSANRWTAGEADEMGSLGFSDDSSFYPADRSTAESSSLSTPGGCPSHGPVIRDAHATTFAIQPGTQYHATDEEAFYVDDSGTVTGLVDYRVELPGDCSLGFGNDREYSWDLDAAEVEWARITDGNGNELDRSSGSHTPRLRFSGLDESVEEIRFEARISVEYTRTKQETVTSTTRYQCGTETRRFWHPLRGWIEIEEPVYCEDETESTVYDSTTETVELTVSDTRNVTLYEPGTPSAYRAVGPDGRTHVRVEWEGDTPAWAGYTADPGGNAEQVQTNVRFYTARNATWDELAKAESDGTTTEPSPVRPVVTHAYRARAGPTVSPRGTVASRTGTASKPELPENLWYSGSERSVSLGDDRGIGGNVNVYLHTENFESVDRLGAVHSTEPSDIQARGIVHGVTPSATVVSDVEVRDVSVEAEILEITGSREDGDVETRVRARLVDESTGDELAWDWQNGDADTAGGKLVFNRGEATEVEVTSGGGTVTQAVSGADTITVDYVPSGWTQSDPSGWSGPLYRGASTAESVSYSWRAGNFEKIVVSGIIVAIPFFMIWYPTRNLTRMIDKPW